MTQYPEWCGKCRCHAHECGCHDHSHHHHHYHPPQDPTPVPWSGDPITMLEHYRIVPGDNTNLSDGQNTIHIGPGMQVRDYDDALRILMAHLAMHYRSHLQIIVKPRDQFDDTALRPPSVYIDSGTGDVYVGQYDENGEPIPGGVRLATAMDIAVLREDLSHLGNLTWDGVPLTENNFPAANVDQLAPGDKIYLRRGDDIKRVLADPLIGLLTPQSVGTGACHLTQVVWITRPDGTKGFGLYSASEALYGTFEFNDFPHGNFPADTYSEDFFASLTNPDIYIQSDLKDDFDAQSIDDAKFERSLLIDTEIDLGECPKRLTLSMTVNCGVQVTSPPASARIFIRWSTDNGASWVYPTAPSDRLVALSSELTSTVSRHVAETTRQYPAGNVRIQIAATKESASGPHLAIRVNSSQGMSGQAALSISQAL